MRTHAAVLAVLAAFCAYFAYLTISAANAGFAGDDPMNLGLYWSKGFLGSFVDGYRPAGALFYLPIYHAFGLNPLPYRLAVFLILGLNTWLSFRVARSLLRSNLAAVVAAAVVCAHGNMAAIYFNTSQIYDILAYFFSVTVLLCYIEFRQRGDLTLVQWGIVVGLYAAALGSKEVAIPVAAWILLYELLFQRPWKLGGPLVLLAGAAASAVGKVMGPNSLSKEPGYLIEMTLHRYFINNRLYLNDLFYASYFDSSRKLIFFWCGLLLICWLARRRELWWSAFVMITATLPLSFTVQPRGGPALYLPWLGWALLIGVLVAAMPTRFHARPTVAGIIAFFFIFQTIRSWHYAKPAFLEEHRPTMSVIAQLRTLRSRPAPGSHVIFLSNPLVTWELYFIAALYWNDPSIDIQLADHLPAPPTPSALESAEWVLDFKGERLLVLKAGAAR